MQPFHMEKNKGMPLASLHHRHIGGRVAQDLRWHELQGLQLPWAVRAMSGSGQTGRGCTGKQVPLNFLSLGQLTLLSE